MCCTTSAFARVCNTLMLFNIFICAAAAAAAAAVDASAARARVWRRAGHPGTLARARRFCAAIKRCALILKTCHQLRRRIRAARSQSVRAPGHARIYHNNRLTSSRRRRRDAHACAKLFHKRARSRPLWRPALAGSHANRTANKTKKCNTIRGEMVGGIMPQMPAHINFNWGNDDGNARESL